MAWPWRRLFRRPDPPPPPAPAVSESQFNALNDRYRELRAKYDAATTGDENRRHWAGADGLSAAAANSPHVRRILRNRSRYEYDNGAYCNGIIRTRADDLVGTGPTLLLLGPDDDLNERAERLVAAWSWAARLAEKLHTMDQARCRDGEAFALLVTNRRLAHPIKLDLRLVEADQVTDPTGLEFPQAGKLDGIEYDDLGQPIAYTVLREHPGAALTRYPMEFDRVPARFVLHWFRVDRPGQVRGIPELASSLPIFPYQRRWTLATLAAAEYAASQAGVLETDGPVDHEPDLKNPFKAFEFDRGMFTELPAGVKLKQIAAEHPNQQYAGFKRENCNEMGRPLRMPSSVVLADSSTSNFSSARLDHFGYRGALGVDRSFAGNNHLDKILAELQREAVVAGILPAGLDLVGMPHLWVWPGWPSMDSDQADQDDVRLRNGTLNRFVYWARQGLDHRAMERQWLKEQKVYGPAMAPAPAKPPTPPDSPEPETPPATNGKPEPAQAAHRFTGQLNGNGRG